jgi:hypothetical protein
MATKQAVTNTPTRPAPDRAFTWPVLREHLQRDGFDLIPNYARPLDGHVVDTHVDPITKQERAVTDYELAGRKLMGYTVGEIEAAQAETLGRKLRQTWDFTVDGMPLRCNESFEHQSNFGLQYASTCRHCGLPRWNNADHPATPLCGTCRIALSDTPRCPEMRCACSTAYKRHGCRCEPCRKWNAAKHRFLYAKRRSNPNLSSVTTTNVREESAPVPTSLLGLRLGLDSPLDTDTPWSAAWTWLPVTVRESLARYEAAIESIENQIQESA